MEKTEPQKLRDFVRAWGTGITPLAASELMFFANRLETALAVPPKVRVLVTGLPGNVMNTNAHSVMVRVESDATCGVGWRRNVPVKGETYPLPKPDCDSCDYKKACVSDDDIDCDFCHKSEALEVLSERFESVWGAVNAVDLVLKVYGRTGADRAESVQRAFTELEQVRFQLDTADETTERLKKAIGVEREEHSKTRAKVEELRARACCNNCNAWSPTGACYKSSPHVFLNGDNWCKLWVARPTDKPTGEPLTCDGCTESTPGTYQCGRCVGKAVNDSPGPLAMARDNCRRAMISLPTQREKLIIRSIDHLIHWAKNHG